MRVDLGEDEEPEIGLIALIDCIFFLLMFFMVATTFKQQEAQRETRQLPIELPVAEANLRGAAASAAELAIGIDAQGRLFLDTEPIGLQALHARLAEAARSGAPPRIRIEADRRTAYQHVVHIVDLCGAEGLTQVSLRTRP